mmetsp:Transcript_73898/g.208616  ORF Transcript_73898/g.208616 Transcript_73898/m.208616 type:complete len:227 (-) Transcript_73898:334-1014(-)
MSLWHRPNTTSRSNLKLKAGSRATKCLKKPLIVVRFPVTSCMKRPVVSRSSMSGGLKNPAARAGDFCARFAPSAARFRTPCPTKRTILYMLAKFTFSTLRLDIVKACRRRSNASFTSGSTSTLCSFSSNSFSSTDAKVSTGGADANSGNPKHPPQRSICMTAHGVASSAISSLFKHTWSFTFGVVSPNKEPYLSVFLISSSTASAKSNFNTDDAMGAPSLRIGEQK